MTKNLVSDYTLQVYTTGEKTVPTSNVPQTVFNNWTFENPPETSHCRGQANKMSRRFNSILQAEWKKNEVHLVQPCEGVKVLLLLFYYYIVV